MDRSELYIARLAWLFILLAILYFAAHVGLRVI